MQHAVYLSFLVTDPRPPFPFAASHRATEEALVGSGMAWTILRPSPYLDALSMVAAEVRADGLFRAPAGDERVSFLSRDDLAGAAATVLVEPGHSGAVLSLTGDDALSYRDVARLLAQATGRPVEYVDEEPSSYRARIGTSMPPSMADAFVAIWRTIREGWLAPVHPHMASLGRAPMSAAAWLTESKTLFVA